MQYKRIIVGDQEIKVPSITIGALPILGIALVLWLLTGIYVVGPDEVGVVQTFGKYSRAAQSGLNYHFPYPIETVKTPKVTEVKRIEIGFRSVGKNQYQTDNARLFSLQRHNDPHPRTCLCGLKQSQGT